jgi:hypothetical protein
MMNWIKLNNVLLLKMVMHTVVNGMLRFIKKLRKEQNCINQIENFIKDLLVRVLK